MVFVDTSFLFALADLRDRQHQTAGVLQREMAGEALYTTNHVAGECWTLVNRRLGHRAALRVLNAVRNSPRYRFIEVGGGVEERAFDWLLRHDEREYSFVDAVSFEVMGERGIDVALAFDDGFEAAGFRTLRP
jgi:predicted nucleic acid-binding protein